MWLAGCQPGLPRVKATFSGTMFVVYGPVSEAKFDAKLPAQIQHVARLTAENLFGAHQ